MDSISIRQYKMYRGMIRNFLIDYVWHPASNARNLLEYAQARERKGLIRIENLAASNPHSTF